ncbi:molybdenum cofactor guanylyltransferase [Wukongibacter baidiensis]|uniref:molybdenum cofactor guanylyltransferase n=1 Tax=Wukongibacter baidiensis TaxID=1723361 RepID=UPI003D7FCADB
MKKLGTAIIMAGGKSSRMGFDKQLIKIEDRYLIDIIIENLSKSFEEIIVVSNVKGIHNYRNVAVVEDKIKDLGPLGGLHAGLGKASSLYSYVIACDMPYINNQYINYMKKFLKQCDKADALITRFGDWIEPFNCFYSKNIVNNIEDHIKSNQKSIYSLMKKLNVAYIEERAARCFSPDWRMFENLNTKEDLRRCHIELKRLETKYAGI